MTESIENPCVRHCCLDPKDVCLGCFRTLDEILAWSAANNAERTVILTKANKRRSLSKQGGTTG